MPDREKVIKGLNYCTHTDGAECSNCPYWKDDDCVETLNADVLALLKAQPEIVRCKDCKHGEKCPVKYKDYWCNIHEFYRDADWFCADGERKEE